MEIKSLMGKHLRELRETHGYSRAKLAEILGISPKTIQSWEMGRTFIENLSIIPEIENILCFSFGSLISQVLDEYKSGAFDSSNRLIKRKNGKAITLIKDTSKCVQEHSIIPVIRKETAIKEKGKYAIGDIIDHVYIPQKHQRIAMNSFGVQIEDRSLYPVISKEGIAVVTPFADIPLEAILFNTCAIAINGKICIRKIQTDHNDDYWAEPLFANNRHRVRMSARDIQSSALGEVHFVYSPMK